MSSSDPTRGGWSRHPITTVVLGFLLTGVLGTLFANYYNQQQAQRERERLAVVARKEAVGTFSRFVYERYIRSAMLASSMVRSAPLDELRERKKSYDQTFVDWNTNHQANLFVVREVLQADVYSEFERYVEFGLVNQIFGPLDTCLTRAYDASVSGSDPKSDLSTCHVSLLIRQALECSYALTNELYKLSAAAPGSVRQEDAGSEVERRCQIR